MKQRKTVVDRVCNNKKNRKRYEELNAKIDKTEEEQCICKYVTSLIENTKKLEHEKNRINRSLLTGSCNIYERKLEILLDELGWDK